MTWSFNNFVSFLCVYVDGESGAVYAASVSKCSAPMQCKSTFLHASSLFLMPRRSKKFWEAQLLIRKFFLLYIKRFEDGGISSSLCD